jgi:hypothetical protein
MKTNRIRIGRWSCVAGVVVLAAAAGLWVRMVRYTLPPGMLKDIRAGLAARHIKDPDERLLKYLDERYGSMSDPAHRQAAFLDFFNVEHVKALQFLVKHLPAERRQASVDAMARWVAAYRASLTAEERTALSAQFETGEGQAMLKRATAQYNSQDVQYRGSTAVVISQLLTTLREIQQPH